ncbi:MAG: 50S ribosomal protein L39e [Candidatus Marsarchaeota archaeon]|jgi:ribosomal protein L39E|nr:50S ribosomal protein L39e [Candidatus Marsarchaeota archaeon]MCL5418887.1 50S ribosomal protein L39e [Candidatus Marsarchaeota archaeon]
MSKKSRLKKVMLGKKLKQSRRIPLLAVLRTHRRIESNRFQRNWRQSKMRLKVD